MSIQQMIEAKLGDSFQPQYLNVVNESHMHSVPKDSETHFKVTLVSAGFSGKRSVARHQAVYAVLREELAGEVHALALHTYSPDEWSQRDMPVPDSPNCLGGSKVE